MEADTRSLLLRIEMPESKRKFSAGDMSVKVSIDHLGRHIYFCALTGEPKDG